MSHNLSLEIPYISNPKVLRIFDTSIWDSDILSSQVKLDIIPPGFIYSTSFTVTRRFDKLYNNSNLGVQPVTDYSELGNLSDGIYIIRLTNIAGSEEEWIEYNHLRQTQLINCWFSALCKLYLNPCQDLTKDKDKIRKELYQIKAYIDSAKAKVEFCNSPNEGLELHNYAKKLLDKFNDSCKNC